MAYYKDRSGKTDPQHDQFNEIFEEFDFTCFDDDCDFFCPECRNILSCSVYVEFKDEWEMFYV